MEKVISTEKVPIKMWLEDIEDSALDQAKNVANLPFAYKWVSILPDAHFGFGCPIGTVLATKDVIVPNIVGKDIGCGMCAVKTSLTEIGTEILKKIMGETRKVIPVGFNKHTEKQKESLMPQGRIEYQENFNDYFSDLPISDQEQNNALKSLGTLGGGNHFIEIQKGSDGHIWIMIHSGSRNLGKQVADHYNEIARELNQKWYSEVPDKWELAFLPIDSKEGQSYIREMNYAVEFALANRRLMMERVKTIFEWALSEEQDKDVLFDEMINIAHNYARQENHFGTNLWVHRKGATSAKEGEIGIIPGSQGTKSYIVKGKGNQDSFESCSHGAGRVMGRKQAQRTLSYEEEMKKMEGVIHGMRGEKDLDEAPGSYKDIDVVMENQKDLVEILVELNPLAIIKG